MEGRLLSAAGLVVGLLLSFSLALPAAARKPRIELEQGFFKWEDFAFSDRRGRPTMTASELLDNLGGYLESHDEVLTYDGDSTLTLDVVSVLKLAEKSVPPRWTVAAIDTSLGQELVLRSAVLRRPGKADEHFTQEDLKEEAQDKSFDYFSNTRVFYLELPEDAVSATLELDLRVTTRSSKGFEGFVQDICPLQAGGYVKDRTLTIRYPIDRPLYLKEKGFTSKVKTKKSGDMFEVKYALKFLRYMAYERWSEHWSANYPAVWVSSVASWDQFNAMASKVYEDKAVADEAIRAQVAALTDGIEGERERAEAIYRFVTGELHYLGIYLGESGWVPHPAADVMERRFGDCKDHTVLLITMLREAGIEAYPAVIHGGEVVPVDREFPVKITNHAIVYAIVDGEGLFLDGVSNPYLFGTPKAWIRNRTAIVHKPTGIEFVETPAGDPGMWAVTENVELELDAEGVMKVHVALNYEGSDAARLRDRFRTRTRADIGDLDRKWVARHYTMAHGLVMLEEQDPHLGGGALERELFFQSAQHVRRSGPVMLLEVPWMEVPGAIAPQTQAHNFPVWVTPLSYQGSWRLKLPPGYRVLEVPEDVLLIKPGGKLQVDFEQQEETFTITVDAQWSASRLAAAAAESYPQFRTALAEALDLQLVLMEEGR